MRQKACLIFTLVAVAVLSLPLYAHDESEVKDGMMCSRDGKSKGMMGGGMMKGGMMGMNPMMMKMMEKSVTATTDGGVVIVSGNKITKYDKNLNVVKEIETKPDMAAMTENMKTMMAMGPMMKGGMKDMDDDDDDKAKEAGANSAPASAASAASEEDHAAHH